MFVSRPEKNMHQLQSHLIVYNYWNLSRQSSSKKNYIDFVMSQTLAYLADH